MVAFQVVGSNSATIPTPPEPNMPDENPSSYVPQGMNKNDRKELREAALEWTGTLGGFLTRQAGRFTNQRPAALNMNHFLTGNGADRVLESGYVDQMHTESGQLATFQNQRLNSFLEKIRENLNSTQPGTVRQYLLLNDEGGVNNGTNWYGIYSNNGTGLYFTLGGFFISYGATAVRGPGHIGITYKMYVWDRYNWDTGKETQIPGNQLSWLLNDGEMDDIAHIMSPAVPGLSRTPYFSRKKDKNGNITYTVDDSLMGSLVESGDAENFDIVGAGNVQSIRFPAADPTPPPEAGGPTEAQSQTASEDAKR